MARIVLFLVLVAVTACTTSAFDEAYQLDTGDGGETDPARAAELYREAAADGSTAAMNNLGVLYETGRGVPQDLARAADLYERAAEGGSVFAQTNLGLLYEVGRGVPQDFDRAAELYRQAAEQGHARAQTNLGWLYETGRGVPKDLGRAAELYRQAAEQGHARAQNNLGWLYENANGVPQDVERAAELYRQAAEQGNATAQTNLAWLYETGRGVPLDMARAAELYGQAAEQGEASAALNLGLLYLDGRGVAANERRAFELIRKAAEAGVVLAQTQLGVMYDLGKGTAVDYAKAGEWARRAAEQGQHQAQMNYGELLEYGKGQPADIAAARRWYARAAEQGDLDGQRALRRLDDGHAGTLDLEQSLARLGFLDAEPDGSIDDATFAALAAYVEDRGSETFPKYLPAVHNELAEEIAVAETVPAAAPAVVEEPERGLVPVGPAVTAGATLPDLDYHALVIGVQDYPLLPLKDQLETPLADIAAVAEVLRSRFGFAVTTLANPEEGPILEALRGYVDRLDDNDSLLVYFAGHGQYDPATRRGYWWPANAAKTTAEAWIDVERVAELVHAIPARHVLVVADSCYSGELVRDPGSARRAFMSGPAFVAHQASLRSRKALASGALQPVADGGGGGNSVFAKAFLEALREIDDPVDMDSVAAVVVREVFDRTRRTTRQTPLYSDIMPPIPVEERGDFVLVPAATRWSEAR